MVTSLIFQINPEKYCFFILHMKNWGTESKQLFWVLELGFRPKFLCSKAKPSIKHQPIRIAPLHSSGDTVCFAVFSVDGFPYACTVKHLVSQPP